MPGAAGSRPRPAILFALALFGVALAGALAEVALRVIGFQFTTFPVVQFGWPEPHEIRDLYVPDREVFWVTRDYVARLADADRIRPAVVFMGDSCTEFSTWPQLTLERLATHDAALARGVTLAVAGWSSEQGLRQLRRDVLPLRPRIVTIYYGWNDHWLAFGEPDGDVHPGAMTFWLTQHLRLAQLVVKSRFAFSRPQSIGTSYRVPLERYRANLAMMGRLARDAGIRPVFITAPAAHQPGREPEYLARRHLRRLEDLIPAHTAYVDATREAARAGGAEICDAAAMFGALPQPAQHYFNRDGIHLNDHGARALAAMLTDCLTGGERTEMQRTGGSAASTEPR